MINMVYDWQINVDLHCMQFYFHGQITTFNLISFQTSFHIIVYVTILQHIQFIIIIIVFGTFLQHYRYNLGFSIQILDQCHMAWLFLRIWLFIWLKYHILCSWLFKVYTCSNVGSHMEFLPWLFNFMICDYGWQRRETQGIYFFFFCLIFCDAYDTLLHGLWFFIIIIRLLCGMFENSILQKICMDIIVS